jgi:hypothetical protein
MEAAWLDELKGEGNRCSLFFCPNNTFASCKTEKLYEFIGFLRKETHNIPENERKKNHGGLNKQQRSWAHLSEV